MDILAPILPPEELPQRPTDSLLIRDMRSFAYNNKAFKARKKDELTLRTSLGEHVPKDGFLQDYGKTGYEFEAIRTPLDTEPKRSMLTLQLSVIVMRQHVELPAHIAVNAYGASFSNAEQAIEVVGSSDLEHRLKFSISTATRVLSTCESYAYIDEEGQLVNYACTCEPSYFYMSVESDDDDDDEDYDYVEYETSEPSSEDPGEGPYSSGDIQPQHESLPTQDTEETQRTWELLGAIEASMTEDVAHKQEEQLLRAFSSFELFKRSLRHQLGLD